MQDSINRQRWEKEIEKKTKKYKTKYVSLLLAFKPWSSWKTKHYKKKSHLNKQTLEPKFYNDSVQIRKLTTICWRINRKSAVYSCLILSTKSSLTCFTTLYWQQLNIVRRMKFMKKISFFFLNFLNRPKSKIKNIVILINYICLNLFEQHHCWWCFLTRAHVWFIWFYHIIVKAHTKNIKQANLKKQNNKHYSPIKLPSSRRLIFDLHHFDGLEKII